MRLVHFCGIMQVVESQIAATRDFIIPQLGANRQMGRWANERIGDQGRWRVVLPLGLALALSLPGDQTLYAVLPNHTSAMGVGVGAVGVLLGVNRLIRIPGNPLAGMLYDRRGRRHLFLLGLLLGVISTAVYGLARGFWPLLAGRLLWGMAWSLINVGGLMMTLDISSDADRGRWIGLYQVFFRLGLAFSPLLGGFLTDALGFRPALLVCAAVTGSGLLIASLALPETRGASVVPARGVASNPQPQEFKSPRGRPDRQILAAAYIYLVTLFAGSGVLMSTISLYLGQRFGDSVSLGGVALGVASLGGITLALRSLLGMLAGPAVGYLSDRRGERWSVVLGGALMGVVGFVVLTLGTGVWGIVIGVALLAFGNGALTTALPALVGDATTVGRRGKAVGWLTMAGAAGSAAGPLLAYALLSVVDLRWVYLLCAVVFFSGVVVVNTWRLREDW